MNFATNNLCHCLAFKIKFNYSELFRISLEVLLLDLPLVLVLHDFM